MNSVMLKDMCRQCAFKCREEGIALDAEPGGAIHRWVMVNVNHRDGTAFFIVAGIAAEMADLDAQDEGFVDQFDRAAQRAFAKLKSGSMAAWDD